MGAASSGGSDNDVSGAEAVYTGGKTYSSRKTKTVNKSIADQNRENRQSRKSPVTKLFEASLIGRGAKAISNSKFVKENNLKSRKAFATKKGLRVSDMSDDFILSSGFKTQLDGLGYSERNNTNNDNDRGGQDQPVESVIVKKNEPVTVKKNIGGTEVQTTQAKIDDQRAKDNEYDIRKIKKRGRRNILTSSKGVTTVSSDYSLGKRSLLGSV
jgi:hypothetical protein